VCESGDEIEFARFGITNDCENDFCVIFTPSEYITDLIVTDMTESVINENFPLVVSANTTAYFYGTFTVGDELCESDDPMFPAFTVQQVDCDTGQSLGSGADCQEDVYLEFCYCCEAPAFWTGCGIIVDVTSSTTIPQVTITLERPDGSTFTVNGPPDLLAANVDNIDWLPPSDYPSLEKYPIGQCANYCVVETEIGPPPTWMVNKWIGVHPDDPCCQPSNSCCLDENWSITVNSGQTNYFNYESMEAEACRCTGEELSFKLSATNSCEFPIYVTFEGNPDIPDLDLPSGTVIVPANDTWIGGIVIFTVPQCTSDEEYWVFTARQIDSSGDICDEIEVTADCCLCDVSIKLPDLSDIPSGYPTTEAVKLISCATPTYFDILVINDGECDTTVTNITSGFTMNNYFKINQGQAPFSINSGDIESIAGCVSFGHEGFEMSQNFGLVIDGCDNVNFKVPAYRPIPCQSQSNPCPFVLPPSPDIWVKYSASDIFALSSGDYGPLVDGDFYPGEVGTFTLNPKNNTDIEMTAEFEAQNGAGKDNSIKYGNCRFLPRKFSVDSGESIKHEIMVVMPQCDPGDIVVFHYKLRVNGGDWADGVFHLIADKPATCCDITIPLQNKIIIEKCPGEEGIFETNVKNNCEQPKEITVNWGKISGITIISPKQFTIPARSTQKLKVSYIMPDDCMVGQKHKVAFLITPENCDPINSSFYVQCKDCNCCDIAFVTSSQRETTPELCPGEKGTHKVSIKNNCKDRKQWSVSIPRGSGITNVNPSSSTLESGQTQTLEITYVMPENCKAGTETSIQLTLIPKDCDAIPYSFKVKCKDCKPCCDVSAKVVSELPKEVKDGESVKVTVAFTNNCKENKNVRLFGYVVPKLVVGSPSQFTLKPGETIKSTYTAEMPDRKGDTRMTSATFTGVYRPGDDCDKTEFHFELSYPSSGRRRAFAFTRLMIQFRNHMLLSYRDMLLLK